MRVSAATLGFASIICVALFAVYRISEPQQLITDKTDSPAELTTAAGVAALANHLTPTATRFPSATPTRKPVVPTDTPHPTYGAGAKPGLHLVPAWTPTVAPAMTAELTYPPCDLVTPRPYADVYCEVL